MTKYSPEFKAQVVVEYMTDGLSSYTLEKKYKVSARQIRKWIQQYQLQGIKSFKQHHRKRIFSTSFCFCFFVCFFTFCDLPLRCGLSAS